MILNPYNQLIVCVAHYIQRKDTLIYSGRRTTENWEYIATGILSISLILYEKNMHLYEEPNPFKHA